MARKIRYRRKPCPSCRDMITTNALGRAAHIRFCDGTPKPEPKPGSTRVFTVAKCQWFLRCTNPATTTLPHPILRSVPVCQSCADKVASLSKETTS